MPGSPKKWANRWQRGGGSMGWLLCFSVFLKIQSCQIIEIQWLSLFYYYRKCLALPPSRPIGGKEGVGRWGGTIITSPAWSICGKRHERHNLGKTSYKKEQQSPTTTSTPFPFQDKQLFKMDDDTLDRIYTGHLGDLPRLSTKVVFCLFRGLAGRLHFSTKIKNSFWSICIQQIPGCPDLHEFNVHGHADGEEHFDGICLPARPRIL